MIQDTSFGYENPYLNIMTSNGNIRCVEINGYMWFVAQDIAIALGYHDAYNMIRSLPDPTTMSSTSSMRLTLSNGKQQTREMLVINEQGLDYLTMCSTKPNARIFQQEVLNIIYTVRHTGVYIPPNMVQDLQASEELQRGLIKEASDFYESQKADPNSPMNSPMNKYMLQTLFRRIDNELNKLENKSIRNKIDAADAMIGNIDGTISLGELAKLIWNTDTDIGRNRLIWLLRKDHWLMMHGGRNIPTQRSLQYGYMIFSEANGIGTARVTPKGQEFFITRYRGVDINTIKQEIME